MRSYAPGKDGVNQTRNQNAKEKIRLVMISPNGYRGSISDALQHGRAGTIARGATVSSARAEQCRMPWGEARRCCTANCDLRIREQERLPDGEAIADEDDVR
ncbi:MAG: hypothetical protein KIT82_16800 [Bradyrhizobium sp.]|nr:hypothetical protein [Bradyrhizobium sp.]